MYLALIQLLKSHEHGVEVQMPGIHNCQLSNLEVAGKGIYEIQ